MSKKILCLPGDGIGPEVMAVTRPIVEAVCEKRGLGGVPATSGYFHTPHRCSALERRREAPAVWAGALALEARRSRLASSPRLASSSLGTSVLYGTISPEGAW